MIGIYIFIITGSYLKETGHYEYILVVIGIYIFIITGSYLKETGHYAYEEGKNFCRKNSLPDFLNLKTDLGLTFWNTVFWSEAVNVDELFSGKCSYLLVYFCDFSDIAILGFNA